MVPFLLTFATFFLEDFLPFKRFWISAFDKIFCSSRASVKSITCSEYFSKISLTFWYNVFTLIVTSLCKPSFSSGVNTSTLSKSAEIIEIYLNSSSKTPYVKPFSIADTAVCISVWHPVDRVWQNMSSAALPPKDIITSASQYWASKSIGSSKLDWLNPNAPSQIGSIVTVTTSCNLRPLFFK